MFELSPQLLRMGAVPGGFGAGDVEERLEVGGGSGGSVGVLLQLRLEFGGALSGLVGGGVRCVKVALQPVGPVAVLGGFRGGDVGERLEIGGGSGGGVGVLLELGFECGGALGGLLGLLVELFLEPVDLGAGLGGSILGSASVVLCFLKLRLELGDTVAHALHLVGRRRAGLVELGLELLGPVAVLGGFGAGDVEERLEVGGGDRGGVGVLLQLGFEFGGALSGLVAGGARLVAFGLGVGRRGRDGPGVRSSWHRGALGDRRRRWRRRRCAAAVGLRAAAALWRWWRAGSARRVVR